MYVIDTLCTLCSVFCNCVSLLMRTLFNDHPSSSMTLFTHSRLTVYACVVLGTGVRAHILSSFSFVYPKYTLCNTIELSCARLFENSGAQLVYGNWVHWKHTHHVIQNTRTISNVRRSARTQYKRLKRGTKIFHKNI